MTFLQPLDRGRDLLAGSVVAGPQSQLTAARCFEHRQLDPQLGDRCAGLPLLDPSTDEAEQLRRAREGMADDR